MAKRIIVIGGAAAGPKAAARARRLDPDAEITIIQKEAALSMAACGYPYYVGGTFDDRNALVSTPTGAERNPRFFKNAKGIAAHIETEVVEIDPKAHTVTCRELKTGKSAQLTYDKLVVATGTTPVRPPLPGIELAGVVTLHSLEDAEYLRRAVDEKKVRAAIVVGGGLIGMETCEALRKQGLEVTVVEMLPQILTFLDPELAALVERHARAKGAQVVTNNAVQSFEGENGRLVAAVLADGTRLECGLAVVAVGVRPNVDLARKAGLEIGERGGIRVNAHLQTSNPDIYAAGDCVEITDRLLDRPTLAPFGDLANLEGRVVGTNIVEGNSVAFPGTFLTGICKVFDFTAGSTGLSEQRAREAGLNVVAAVVAGPHLPHFMQGKPLVSKIVADAESGKLLGFQCVGLGDVSRQVTAAATALLGGLTVTDLAAADFPYAPPFSAAIDHLIVAAHVLENKTTGRFKGISATEVKARLDKGEKPFLLDLRGPDEYEQMRLGVGETLIPLGALRGRLDELPQDKNAAIICFCKISLRGYEAARLLEGRGWRNVKVMEGGVLAWPFDREK